MSGARPALGLVVLRTAVTLALLFTGGCAPPADATGAIDTFYAERISGRMVESGGTVTKLLRDDNEGSRHQRFIIRLESGLTVLIAHNIDLARRIDAIRTGERVKFFGQYEFNDRGGVIHWTHRAPLGDHADGWIEHAGIRYE